MINLLMKSSKILYQGIFSSGAIQVIKTCNELLNGLLMDSYINEN